MVEPPGTAAPPSAPRCRVCHSPEVTVRELTRPWRGKSKTCSFQFCAQCGFIANPENKRRYKADGTHFGEGSQPAQSRRAGDGVRGGREYFMLKTAIEILGRSDLEVLFHGSGLSRDYELARTLPQVASSHFTDLHNYQESSSFIPLDSSRQFDVVICCEVIEHFEHPRRDFPVLLKFAKFDGLVVCSTSVSDGTALDKVRYPWTAGHVSYYSGSSLLNIAEQNGLYCDFRLPECALRDPGPRKRYVFFFQDPENQSRIQEAFSRLTFAYSERATNRRRRARRAAQKKKRAAGVAPAASGSTKPSPSSPANPPTFREVVHTAEAWRSHAFKWRIKRLKRRLGLGRGR